MPKKTTILILILAVVTGVLVFLAVTSENQKNSSPTPTPSQAKKAVKKTARVFFSPQNLDLSAASATGSPTVDIMVDTGGADIAGVQAEMQYDPNALTNMRLIPSADTESFFGETATVLFNEVEPEMGRISFAIAISSGQTPVNGVGKIASLTFQKGFAPPTVSTITFLNKTLVTVIGQNESVLKETVPLSITLIQGQPTQAPFIPPVTAAPTLPPQ